jgi:hypothetical protein
MLLKVTQNVGLSLPERLYLGFADAHFLSNFVG